MPLRIDVFRYRGQPVTEPLSVLFDREGGTIGRSPDCDMVLSDDCVSRKHARITFSAGRYHLTDESANGTLIANRDLLVHYDRVELEEGDTLRIGDFDLEVNYVERVQNTHSIRAEESQRQPRPGPVSGRVPDLADTPPQRRTGPSLFVKELSIDDFFKDPDEDSAADPGKRSQLNQGKGKQAPELQLDERKVDDFFQDIDNFFNESAEADSAPQAGRRRADPLQPSRVAPDVEQVPVPPKENGVCAGNGSTEAAKGPVAVSADLVEAELPPAPVGSEPVEAKLPPVDFRTDLIEAEKPPEVASSEPVEAKLPPVDLSTGSVEAKQPPAAPSPPEEPKQPPVAPSPGPAEAKQPLPGISTDFLETGKLSPVIRPDVTDPVCRAFEDRTDPIIAVLTEADPAEAKKKLKTCAGHPGVVTPPVLPTPRRPSRTEPIKMAEANATPPCGVLTPVIPASAPQSGTERPVAVPPAAPPPAAALNPPASEMAQPPVVDIKQIRAELFNLFLKGARLEEKGFIKEEEIPVVMETIGAVFRELATGLCTVLKGRTELKSEFRLAMTMVRPFCNNPLKLSPRVEDAMKRLLKRDHPSFLEPVEAVREGFEDVMNHQIAMNAGMRASLAEAMDKFDPECFGKLKESSLFGAKGKCWQNYCDAYDKLREQATEGIFGKAFVKAYEEQLEKMRSRKKN